MMNNLALRAITAIFGSAAIIFCIVFSQFTFVILFFIISILTHAEYLLIIQPLKIHSDNRWHIAGNLATGIIAYLLIAGIAFNILPSTYIAVLLLIIGLFFVLELFQKRPLPFQHIGLRIIGLLYIVIPFALLNTIAIDGDVFNPILVLGLLFTIWSHDVMAYFIGRYLGKHKLFESISPKKTWEGFFGGLIAAIICCFIFSMYSTDLSVPAWIGLGLLISITGTLGDLVESLFKRSLHLKDSGNILPGHGGFLDRFDALIMAIPFVVVYLLFVG